MSNNVPLWAAITQLAPRCCDINMGFQKLETISFELMYLHIPCWTISCCVCLIIHADSLSTTIFVFILAGTLYDHGDYLDVFGGLNSSSPLLGRLTPGAPGPSNGYTSSTGLYLRLNSHLGKGGRLVVAYAPFQIVDEANGGEWNAVPDHDDKTWHNTILYVQRGRLAVVARKLVVSLALQLIMFTSNSDMSCLQEFRFIMFA